MRKLRWAAAALALGMLTAACGGGGDEVAEDGVIKIAAIYPMTGPASVWGTTTVAAMQQMAEDVNAEGGVTVDGEDYTIQIDVFDDEQNPEVAQSVAREALDDGYHFIMGPFGSGTATATQSLMAQSDAYWQLMVATVEGPTKNPNVFRSGARVSVYTQSTLDWLERHPEIKRIAMITDQMHTGLVSEEDALVAGIEALGREVVLQQSHQLGDTDFRAPITEMLSKDVDLYMTRAYPAETVLITQQVRELGGEMLIQWNGGLTNAEVDELIGDETVMENVTQAGPLGSLDSFIAAENPIALAFAEKVGDKAGSFTVNAHDGMVIFFQGLEKADELSVDGLIKALNELQVSDIEGKTLATYAPHEGGLVYQDREVNIEGAVTIWEKGTGWVLAD
ncbi:ABC transporter substrate-binding protein [Nocardioides sp. AE5]|uniref:ABC transporter substrate-binding protein n=1 Tax=Nocardioides sp. AE5 TaxID=2962573 RepID=UPI002881A69B|nr:ABC transporter substrate-binding protein [Nocardioides sp. AE5]MDT0202718.1 ABC transporter substrate-binding protein [Nocardioides sp. AE5]